MWSNRKLYIQFVVGNNRFVLPASDVIGIVPLATLHDVPRAPEYVAGILNYHGLSVPVIDMTRLMAGTNTELRLSARIVLLKVKLPDNSENIVGLLAEKVTEVMRLFESEFKKSGVQNNDTKYLGDVITDEYGILQRLNVSELLPKTAKKMLFESAEV
ncbi:chemotaxis protein CheW [Kaarinaea lacus]